MEKYRIRTEQEFLNEFGENWRSTVKAQFPEPMNHLLGIPLDEEDNLRLEQSKGNGHLHVDGFTISKDMIIPVDFTKTSSLDLNRLLKDDLKITLQQNN